MESIIVLLHLLMQNPDTELPEPAEYLQVYCQYHDHVACDPTEESIAPANDKVLT